MDRLRRVDRELSWIPWACTIEFRYRWALPYQRVATYELSWKRLARQRIRPVTAGFRVVKSPRATERLLLLIFSCSQRRDCSLFFRRSSILGLPPSLPYHRGISDVSSSSSSSPPPGARKALSHSFSLRNPVFKKKFKA